MKREHNHVLKINSACVSKNYMWMFLEDANALCKINLNNGDICFVSCVPGEALTGARLYGGILCYQDKLILVPESAKEIAIYDIDLNIFEKLELNDVNGDPFYNPYVKFFSGVVVGSLLYLIPRKYPALVEIDLETKQITYHSNWVRDFEQHISEKNRAFFKEDVILIDKKMYFCSPSNSYSLEFDIITKKSRLINIGFPTCDVFELNGYATYLSADCGIFQNKDEKFECVFPHDHICGPVNFNKSFDVGSYIYFAPCKSNQILAFNKEKRKWITMHRFVNGEISWKHLGMTENKVYFYNQNDGKVHVLSNGEWIARIKINNINQLMLDVNKSKICFEPICENEHFGLIDMINMLGINDYL